LTGEVNLTELRRVLVQQFKVPRSVAATLERELREHTIVPKPS